MTLYYFPFGKANESAWKNKIYVKISTKRETFFIFFRFGMKIPRKLAMSRILCKHLVDFLVF